MSDRKFHVILAGGSLLRVGGAALVGFVLALAGSAAAWAQQPAKAPVVINELDPNALAALKRMGDYLRTLKSFSVRAESTKDEVLESGQKIQFASTVNVSARLPDRLRLDVTSDRKQRQIYYDGSTVTQYAPRVGYYASVKAPRTVRETLALAADKYDLEVPLADLFYWGTDQSGIDDIKTAIALGPSRVAGVETDHYAFRQEGIDWQIWIERGKTPLPRKLLITTLDEPSQPQYTAVLHWDLKGGADGRTYAFVPPKDARKIVMAPDAAAK